MWEASLDLVEYLITVGIGGIGRRMDGKETDDVTSKAGETGSPCTSASESAHARAEFERPPGECTERGGDRQPGKDTSRAKGCLERVLEVYREGSVKRSIFLSFR